MFASLFSKPVWKSAIVLLVGAILVPGKRTVSAILRVMGWHHERHFQNYHRVLNRAVWSTRHASRLLLQQIVNVFAPSGGLVIGIDDPIERRWGKRITARGIYRDPVRSSDSHFSFGRYELFRYRLGTQTLLMSPVTCSMLGLAYFAMRPDG